jgi:hypothetical protein
MMLTPSVVILTRDDVVYLTILVPVRPLELLDPALMFEPVLAWLRMGPVGVLPLSTVGR